MIGRRLPTDSLCFLDCKQRKTIMQARALIVAAGLFGLLVLGAHDAGAQSTAVAPAASPPASSPTMTKRLAPVYPTNRPRIGLALSGGGARGFAHVGVLRALETLKIPVDCIAGTSAGSAVAAAYASGLSPDAIEKFLKSADWDRDMFDDLPPRKDLSTRRKAEEKSYLFDVTVGLRDGSIVLPPGLISGQKIELFLHGMLGESGILDSFDQLPIPFRAMATDLEAGELVVQDRGSLVTAVRASMAVPSAFAPVQSDGKLLVDGGLTRNMPVDIVRKMCADVVIAVDIGSPLLTSNGLSVVGSRHAECIPLEVRHPRPVVGLRVGGRPLDDHQPGIEGHRIGMAGMGRCHRRFFPTHAGLEGECTERIDAERAPPVDIVVRDLRRSAQAIECFGLLGDDGNARAPAGLDSGLQGQPC